MTNVNKNWGYTLQPKELHYPQFSRREATLSSPSPKQMAGTEGSLILSLCLLSRKIISLHFSRIEN